MSKCTAPRSPRVAIAYLRASRNEQRLSREAQRTTIEAWAIHEGVRVAAWCIDHGVRSVSPMAETAACPAMSSRSFARTSAAVFSQGFSRAHCDTCGHDLLVAFSCHGRSICPSCCGRRMANVAAHLVENVLS